MNRAGLAVFVANRLKITHAEAAEAVTAVLDGILYGVKEEGFVRISAFGTFSVEIAAARNARNPQTGETVRVKARNVFKFRVSKNISDALLARRWPTSSEKRPKYSLSGGERSKLVKAANGS